MKLAELKEGDKFSFVKARRKPQGKVYVVEGQYPLKKITTVFSEDFLQKNEEAEPIAVNNSHEVKLLNQRAYSITHKVKLIIAPKMVPLNTLKKGDCFEIPNHEGNWSIDRKENYNNYFVKKCTDGSLMLINGSRKVKFPVQCKCKK